MTHAWIPTQKVGFALLNKINAGAGGTSSWYGLIRLTSDVVAYSPDVVVFEWIANDTTGAFYERSSEAFIRRLRTELPNAKLVFLAFRTFTDVGADNAADVAPLVTSNYRTLCSMYGIPFIDYGAEVERRVGLGAHLSVYQYDTKHPTDAGHQLAHELVRSTVLSAFTGSSLPAMPARLYDCADFEATPIDRAATTKDAETGTWATVSTTYRQSNEANATISFTDTFVGCGLAFANTGTIQWSLDGGAYSASLDLTLVGSARELITNIVTKEAHTLTVKVISGTVTIHRFIAI